MRVSGIVWIAFVACAIAAVAWAMGRVVHRTLPALAPPSAQTLQTSRDVPPADVAVAEQPSLLGSDAGSQPYWRDPSVDPKALERAFAPAPPVSSLPPEARPTTPAINPPEREWRRVQRNDQAVAY